MSLVVLPGSSLQNWFMPAPIGGPGGLSPPPGGPIGGSGGLSPLPGGPIGGPGPPPFSPGG